jgi:hypothetical protein
MSRNPCYALPLPTAHIPCRMPLYPRQERTSPTAAGPAVTMVRDESSEHPRCPDRKRKGLQRPFTQAARTIQAETVKAVCAACVKAAHTSARHILLLVVLRRCRRRIHGSAHPPLPPASSPARLRRGRVADLGPSLPVTKSHGRNTEMSGLLPYLPCNGTSRRHIQGHKP